MFTPALLRVESVTVSSQDGPPEKASEHQALEIEKRPQRVFAPHWTTEATYSTTLYIRNVHFTQAIIARASLILDNRTIALPDIFVDSLQTVSIDVGNALRENKEMAELSGGAVIEFEAESAGVINAYAQVLDTVRSLSFSFPFVEDGAPASGPLDAVAWYYSKSTDAFVALQNTKDEETSASLTIFVSGQPIDLGTQHLKPHEVAAVKLPSLGESGNKEGLASAGVRVAYEGKPGAVVTQGWIVDESIGFSAPFAFHPESNCGCSADTQHKYGAGIMIGKGGMSLPAPGFSPYLVMSNSSDKPLTTSPVFSYGIKENVEKISLPAIALGARKTAVTNLRDYQERGIIPSWVEMGDVDVQYRGEAGALIAELASVDPNGSFVSPVRLICSGNRDLHMAFWRTDAEWHSSITIENIASEENDVEITISYPGGIYVVEEQISAGRSAMISINELQQSQQPDALGRRIPKDATMGGVNIWSKNVHNGLVINAMLMNPVTRTCGQCTDPGYVTQNTVSDKPASTGTSLFNGFDPHVVGLGFQIYMNVHYSSGSQSGDTPLSTSSSNTGVATVSGTYATPVSPGTANITANSRSGYFTDSACSQPGYLPSRTEALSVIKVDIKRDGSVITNTTGNVIVGQKISLTAEVQPTGVTITNQRWTIPPIRVANYVANATSGMVTDLADTPGGPSVDFYWVDGGDGRQVQISLKVNGVSFAALATFNVKRPTAQVTSTTGTVEVSSANGYLALQYGRPGTPGILWTANATIPQGFSGAFQWVQLAYPSRRRQLSSNGTWEKVDVSGLDTYYPYPFNEDSPDTSLSNTYLEKQVNTGRVETWLMFKPSLSNSIWVPVSKIDWSWSGRAVRSGSTWTLVSGSHTQNPSGTDSTTHPQWTRLADVVNWVPE